MRLRIISGELGGRFIQAPQSKETRPTTDRVRETLFNILLNLVDFEDIRMLDLYAGSGALGFESLSRGAGFVQFIERNFQVYKNLNNNIAMLGVQDRVTASRMEVTSYCSMQPAEPFHLILADPPFFAYDVYTAVKGIFANRLLAEDGLVVIERSIQTEEKDKEGFGKTHFRRIGDTLLYRFDWEDKGNPAP